MNIADIKSLQAAHMVGVYAPQLLFVEGRGARLWDADGKEYLDFGAGISVCSLGHCHPAVTAAIREQAGKLVHVSNLYMNEVQPRLAATIAARSFGGQVFFCNSGAEANEALIKFARKWGSASGRYEIVCMDHSFHGRTIATLAATGKAAARAGFDPLPDGFKFVPFNDLDAVAAAIGEQTVAVMLEPIQGEGGIFPADPAYLQGLRTLCDERQLMLLFDEVQCGMGRTGKLFASQYYGVQPDAMSLAKALGNGYPIGALVTAPGHEDVFGVGSHATTFGGTPLACAASLAVFETIEREHVLDNVQAMSKLLVAGLEKLVAKHACATEVRGVGLMLGVQLVDRPVGDVVKAAAAAGLIVLSAGDNVLRLLPPLTIDSDDVEQALGIIDQVLGD